MIKNKKRHAHLLKIAMIFSTISSASILLCTLAETIENSVFLFIIPIVFWGGLVIEQILFWQANKLLKLKNNRIQEIGLFSFGKTKLGLIADYTLGVAVVLYSVFFICGWGEQGIQFFLLFCIVLAFRMHCIANGRNYRYKTSNERGKKTC